MKPVVRKILAASLAVVLAALPAISDAQGRHGGGWHGGGWHGGGGHGWGWGPAFGVALGVDLALLSSSPYYYGPGYGYDYAYPRTVVVAPPPVVYAQSATPAPANSSSNAEPIYYPRNGQSAEQTESDIRACNSWATTQPKAMADASVFHRATGACMDGRGYTMR